MTRIPAALAARMPLWESSIAAARVGSTPSRRGRLEVDVRGRLAVGDLLRRDRRLEVSCDAHQVEREVDQLAVRGRGEGQRPALREALDRGLGAGDHREVLAVAILESADDLGVDLVGRLREAYDIVHVARPLGRAHAHHVPLGALVPAAAALFGELLAGLVPDLLGVEQEAVQVEDDALNHRPR
jgi:hypothetical protein